MPSWELFEAQSIEYRETVLPSTVWARVSVEAASPFGWERYVGPTGAIIGVDHFGASAPGPLVMAHYGSGTTEHVVAMARAVLVNNREAASLASAARPVPMEPQYGG